MESRICRKCSTTLTQISGVSERGGAQWWCPFCDRNHLNLLGIEGTELASDVVMSAPEWLKLARKAKEDTSVSDITVSYPDKDLAEAEVLWEPSEGEKAIEKEVEELKKRREK